MNRPPTEMETRCNEAAKKAYMVDRKPLGIGIVRDMIHSMRQPTDEMVAIAQEKYKADLNGVGRTIIGCVYMAMIDAASPPEE